MQPSVEAERAADELEREDDKPWDEDFKLALALAFDRFGADRVRDYVDGKPTLQSASAQPNPFRAALQSRLTEIAEEHAPKQTGEGE